jgi:hypothetical protein
VKKIIVLIFYFLGFAQVASADRWDFLPVEPLFNPLIGDIREPQYAIVAQPDSNHYDASIGQALDLIQWQSDETTKWAWGLEGDCFLELDSLGGAIFPLRVSDWYLGTYFTEKSGNWSNRLEFEHVSSHLGDELFYGTVSSAGVTTYPVQPIIYSRESLRLTSSYYFSDQFRIYGGPCFWTHLSPDPDDPRLFFHAGFEFYSDYFRLVSVAHIRGYLTYDVKVLGEAGGVIDQTLQLGIQWRWKRDSHQSIRTAFLFYTGNNPYGQFYNQPDTYWGAAIFFDP